MGEMKYVTLNNSVKMPLMGLGTWDLRGTNCIRTVRAAIDMGYRLIDTAQMYSNEAQVGRAIRQSSAARDELFITTKIYRISNSYQKAKEAIERSLDYLMTDYVDLLLLHEPYRQGPEMYRALEDALKEGKARAIGISNYDEAWYSEFLSQCDVVPAVNQLEAHVFYQKWDYQKQLEKNGTMMQAWAPLGEGIGNIPTNPLLSEIGSKYGKTAAQVALRFLVQRGISVIPKSRHPERLEENMNIFDFNLSDEDISLIKTLDRDDTFFSWTKAF